MRKQAWPTGKEKQKVKLVIDTLTGTNWELAEPRAASIASC